MLQVIYKNLSQNKITTKRDIFYNNVKLFKSQQFSNKIIDSIAVSFSLDLAEFNIYPNQKGLVFKNSMKEPILVPMKYESLSLGDVKLIVIIEKDAVFKSFCHFIRKFGNLSSVLVVTGKGYPDNLTKQFVNYLTTLNVPIWGFMDSDIYGFHIFKSFINSAKFLFKFKGFWLANSESNSLITISLRDFKLMQNFLCHPNQQVDEIELKVWRREIQRGLFLFKKAEMEAIESECAAGNPNIYIFETIYPFLHDEENTYNSGNSRYSSIDSSLTVAEFSSQHLLDTQLGSI